jgi:hypothetical protein
MGYKDRMISGVLENIVMLELKRRGLKFLPENGENGKLILLLKKMRTKYMFRLLIK